MAFTSIWHNVFFYFFTIETIAIIWAAVRLTNLFTKKNADIKLMQQQHVAKVNDIRKEHEERLENLRIEMLKREEERTRQWAESEKETLHVLNGVSTLLDLSEKIGRVESEKILNKLNEIHLIESGQVLKKLNEIQELIQKKFNNDFEQNEN